MANIDLPVPVQVTVSAGVTPGYKTSEWWLKLIAVFLVTLEGSGLIPITGKEAQLCAMIITMLGAYGYTAARTSLKRQAMTLAANAASAANDNAGAPPADATAAPRVAQAGFVGLDLLLTILGTLIGCGAIFMMLVGVTSCSWFKGEANKAESVLIDCTNGEMPAIEKLATTTLIGLAAGSVTIDDVQSSALLAGEKIGGCWLANIMDDIDRRVLDAASGSSTAPTMHAHIDQLRQLQSALTLEPFRAKLKTAVRYHTKLGNR